MIKRIITSIFLAFFLSSFPVFAAPSAPEINAKPFSTKMIFSPGGVIVKFKSASPNLQANARTINGANSKIRISKLFKKNDMTNKISAFRSSKAGSDSVDEAGVYKIEYQGRDDVFNLVEELKRDPNVEYAEPNYMYQASMVPNDPEYEAQWAVTKVGGPAAWDVMKGDPQLVIAVIDTGVDYNHPDLAQNIWTNTREAAGNGVDDDGNGYIDDVHGWNFVNVPAEWLSPREHGGPSNDPMDILGHGTHVAGIAAGRANNGVGIAGIAWNCKIMPLKAGYEYVDGNGYLELADITQAIYYAADNGAKVINMSFGSYYDSQFMQDAIDYAHSKGCVLVAASGNVDSYDAGRNFYPAADKHVIAVSSVDNGDKISIWNFMVFSNFGDFVDICAPGTSILSTLPSGAYGYASGTSMAAPFVSGVCALVMSKYKYTDPDQVEARIKSTAFNIYGINSQTFLAGKLGAGRVDAKKAMGNLSMAITYPRPSSILSGSTVIRGSANMENFTGYRLEYSNPSKPDVWTKISESTTPVDTGLLAIWSINDTSSQYNIKLTVSNSSGETYEYVSEANFGENGETKLSSRPMVGPSPFNPDKGQLLFYYDLLGAADVNISVYDITGTLIWQKDLTYDVGTSGTGGSAGPNRVYWDGTNSFGASLGSGAYIYMIIANSGGERKIIGRGKFAVLRS